MLRLMPLNATVPESGRSSPESNPSSVLLPEPETPRIASDWPAPSSMGSTRNTKPLARENVSAVVVRSGGGVDVK